MALGFADEVIDAPVALLVPSTELLPDQRAFIIAYCDNKTIKGAEKASKIHHFYHYEWMKDDANYFAAFTRAKNSVLGFKVDNAEDVTYQRGFEGYDYEVLGKDGGIVTLQRYSELASMFWLKKHNKEYRENNKGDTTININGSDAKVAFNFDQFRNLLK